MGIWIREGLMRSDQWEILITFQGWISLLGEFYET